MKKKQLQNSFYSLAHAHVYDKVRCERLANQVIAVIENYLTRKPLNAYSCLDLGCSTGIMANKFASRFKKVVGIDVDKSAVTYAKKKYKRKNLTFFTGDATKLKFPANTFDIIVCQELYENLYEQQVLFDEIFRVLTPNGICYFAGDNLLFPIETHYRIPFIHYLPKAVEKKVIRMLGHEKYYIGNWKTFWQIKKMCQNFIIHDYTKKILRDPQKYKFLKLYKYKKMFNMIPESIFSLLYYFLPTYIFILQKPKMNTSNHLKHIS